MKAFVLRSYGSADQLELADVATPVPADDEVLVRVRASSVNPYDWHLMRGEPYVARFMSGAMGLLGPKLRILGCDMSGQVESVGAAVTAFSPGDAVFGLLEHGGFGQYVTAGEQLLAPMPRDLSYEQAAALPMAAVTALLAVRDAGRVQAGHSVLVNGASGGVGTYAVQIARALGAMVTGICSARNADLVRFIGADQVIDYTTQDVAGAGRHYDVVIDIAGSRAVTAYRRVVSRDTRFVVVGGLPGRWLQPAGHLIASLALAPLVPPRVTSPDVLGYQAKKAALMTLAGLVDDGRLAPVIDRSYPFDELRAAVAYQEGGHARGKVVLTV
jgi:NADPH:quinone reductase-like Zn-dependent oxidoreductase